MVIGLRQCLCTLALWGALVSSVVAEIATDEAKAEIFTRGDLEITDPWAASAIGDAHTAKIFFEFRNRGIGWDIGAGALLTNRIAVDVAHETY